MKVLIAPDKFKNSLTAKEVCAAVERGLLKIDPSLSIESIPLADGGEGTCEILTEHSKGSIVYTEVSDPLFRKITAHYGISGDGSTAFIEMASASGLQLLSKEERNPAKTSTYGTGELIKNAIDRGVRKITLAIGGSATNDAGMGMVAALGTLFFDKNKNELSPIGENLIHINEINTDSSFLSELELETIVLCDVTNELFGIDGAAYVYAKQKGARDGDLQMLDLGLKNFASCVTKDLMIDVNFPGAGAAGGLGAGAKAFLNATFKSGIDYLLDTLKLEGHIKNADLIITGEGKMDQQTLSGKVVMGVAQLAANHKKPVIAITGKNELSQESIQKVGLQNVITLINETTTEAEAIKHAANLITDRISLLLPTAYFNKQS